MRWLDVVQWLFPIYEGHHVTPLSIYSKKDLEEQRRYDELQLRAERVSRALEELEGESDYLARKHTGPEQRKI